MNLVMVNLTSGLFHLESFKSKSVHVLRQSENTSVLNSDQTLTVNRV